MTNKIWTASPLVTQRRQRFWGILTRKERWGLSWFGGLIVFTAILLMFYLFWLSIYPFLAVTQRTDADYLVVEGWIHDYAIRAAVSEFRASSYQRVFATGGPTEGTGEYTNDYNTSANVGADLLKKDGLPAEIVQVVPSHVTDRDRTYSSAVALRNWFRGQRIPVHSLDIVTEALHARRTRLLFQEAFGPETVIGIIAVPTPDYDPHYWWHYSEGLKDVFGETVAYFYVKLFFRPPSGEGAQGTPR